MKKIKTYKLGIVDWQVDYIDYDEDNGYGLCEYNKATITIYDTTKKVKITEQQKSVTFYHELIHSILGTLNYKELNNDEEFVERFAVMLAQFEETKK